jgi:AcrR family transcriptional regulator
MSEAQPGSESTPRGPGRPAQISRHQVVTAACTIADAEGLNAVSMRAVAKHLGVAAMGLYRHITDKESLLEAMVEQVAAEYDYTQLPTAWRDGLVALARQQRALIARHPWLPDLASRYHPLGPATLAYVECTLSLFERAGTPPSSQLETVGLFNGIVTTLCVAATRPAREPDEDQRQRLIALLATGDYPCFAALAGHPHMDLDVEFDRIVGRLIDGLAHGG